MHWVADLHRGGDTLVERRTERFMKVSINDLHARNPVWGPNVETGDEVSTLTSFEHVEHGAGLDIGHS